MIEDFDKWRASSPFYDETHEALSRSLRTFIEREAAPFVDQWERDRMVPRTFHRKAGEAGILGLGFPEAYGGVSEGVNSFHQLVQVDEIARLGAGGVRVGLGMQAVTVPPILLVGSDELKARVVPHIVSGEKISALAITEPSGGSDVAQLKTRAERKGDVYVVNGSKTFISNGMRADYYITAVRTGGPGMGGISLLLIEPGARGFERTPLSKMGYHCSDTASLYFDDVEVPAANLIGVENGSFKHILNSFNFDRLTLAQQCVSYARVCLSEAAEWGRNRETFGKKLGQHPVIRSKLADMARMIAATQSWVDLLAWQYDRGVAESSHLGLLKVQATRMYEQVAREAAQVLGGASYITGSKVERLYREVRAEAIAGGSEEIMLDMAGRQLGYG
jgi:acyl-CoA dehydrogenase